MVSFIPSNRLERHGLFWLLMAVYFFVPQWIYPDYIDTVTHYYFSFDYQHSPYFLTILFLYVFGVGMLYAYAFLRWVMPPLLTGRYATGIGRYLLVTVVSCYLARILKGLHMAVVDPLLQDKPFRPFDSRHFHDYFFNQVYIHEYSTVILVLAVYRFFTNWRQKQREASRLEHQKTSAEINLIKTRVNPDFLFSSLEGLATLIQQKSNQAPELVLKLAHLLRYVLYESQADRVLLNRELDVIDGYVCLQRTIGPKLLEMAFTVRGTIDSQHIAPLSLFPIVETMVSRLPAELTEPTWVSIDLALTQTHVTLKVIDGQGGQRTETSKQLADIQKQLYFHYGDSYILQEHAEPDAYIVTLTLPLVESNRSPAGQVPTSPQSSPDYETTLPAG